jgi:NTP pyrophosphatase (non-canonical NTP hydrolase)
MDFKQYQKLTNTTAKYPQQLDKALPYLALGLNGESGEVAEIVKKIVRKGLDFKLLTDQTILEPDSLRSQIKAELGDCLWYIAQTCDQCNFDLEEVAQANIDKLTQRNKDNNIQKID